MFSTLLGRCLAMELLDPMVNSKRNILRNVQFPIFDSWSHVLQCSLNPSPRIPFSLVRSPISWAPPPNFSWADQPNAPFHRPSPSWTRTGMASSTRMIWGTPLLLLVCPPPPLDLQEGLLIPPSWGVEGMTTEKVKSLSFFKETAQSCLDFKTNVGR